MATFVLHYVNMIGDFSGNGTVDGSDVSAINAGVPNLSAADNDRREISGDSKILNADVGLANTYTGGGLETAPDKEPLGHTATCQSCCP